MHELAHVPTYACPSTGGRMQTLCIGSTLKSPPTPGCVEGPRVGHLFCLQYSMRAVVTGCGLTRTFCLLATGWETDLRNLAWFLITLSTIPCPSGILLAVWGIWPRHWAKPDPKSWELFLRWACSAHEYAQKHAPCPASPPSLSSAGWRGRGGGVHKSVGQIPRVRMCGPRWPTWARFWMYSLL